MGEGLPFAKIIVLDRLFMKKCTTIDYHIVHPESNLNMITDGIIRIVR
jgi:hypothetical protein